ncbi:MAG TPA: aromatic ring-hydroxylating dioxygenase subunit alpha [Chthoniobacterales bacterium]|jgi:Rieske 2Fe-2S family protein|nr:aromatic ring-hydroxylating dioxygenase subunit alpha [Chthoniobacterales bacterium]
MKEAATPSLEVKITESHQYPRNTLPQKYFVSLEVFAKEEAEIFPKEWLLVGHQSQLKKSGDFFLATITGESVIVTRDQKSQVRGFYNVCRHRGTRLKEDSCGHASAIQCPYHAWTYGLDGRLIGAPHMDEVPGFDKADYPLHPVNIGIWEGFIFVNLNDGEARLRSEATARQRSGDFISLEHWFAPLNGKFSHWNMSILQPAKRIEYDVRANWKLMFENYSECYHCPGVHPMLSKVSPYDSAENDLAEGPFLGGFMKINPGKSLSMSGNTCALPIRAGNKELATASPSGGGPDHDYQVVFYYSIFPNMLLSLHPEYVMVHQLWPQSPERTLIVCDWFFHPDAFTRKDFKPEDAIEFWDMTNKQDWHVCELSQQGIASRAYEPGPYSSREKIPAAWDEYYLRIMK